MAGLIAELQRDALNSTIPLNDLLRKALVVARKLGIEQFERWISRELNGYKTQDEMPEFRQVGGVLKAWNPYCGWIPLTIANTDFEKEVRTRKVKQSVSELQSVLEHRDKNGYVLLQFGPDLEKLLMDEDRFKPALHVGANSIEAILNCVRNTVLEWVLKLEEEGIIGEGMSFSKEEKAKAEETPSIRIENFQGIFGNVSDSNVRQNLEMSMKPGDFKTLADFLRNKKVDKEDISELRNALGSDPKPESADAFGEKVSSWIGTMVKKAASGAWQVSITTAGNILAGAIKAYYGF